MTDVCLRCGEPQGAAQRRIRRLDTLGQLAGAVVHEYNNTLGVILHSSELLLDGEPLADSQRADIERIQRAATRARQFTQRLATFGRSPRARPLDCDAAIAAMQPGVAAQCASASLRFDVSLAGGATQVRADPAQFETLVHALVANALDAMQDGGTLSLATRRIVVDEAFASAHGHASPGDYVELSVTDAGPGVPADVLEQIFEPFVSTKPRGMGLGLAAVFVITKSMGGFVRAENQPQGGARFSIYLPIAS
jgi:two-component system cell cycle sensor histidine kinase/response regulator CckA